MIEQTEAISTERALKLVLEALELEEAQTHYPSRTLVKAITALREALTSVPDWAREAKEQPAPVAKPRKQESVAVRDVLVKIARFLGVVRVYAQDIPPKQELETDKPLHWKARELQDEVISLLDTTSQAQRTWVHATEWRGLTDEDIASLDLSAVTVKDAISDVRAVEAKLKEKNA